MPALFQCHLVGFREGQRLLGHNGHCPFPTLRKGRRGQTDKLPPLSVEPVNHARHLVTSDTRFLKQSEVTTVVSEQ